ncbi:hypothetical protein OA005_02655 [Paracoccaceae bacterium]|nr:hypothetical protein [Paracoccaceae bacterium]
MSNYCPVWIASIVTAHSAMDFLTGSSQLDMISRKYARGLSTEYNEIHPGYIASIAEGKLRTLAEIEAAENATLVLNAYIYRRFRYNRDNKPRKISGMFKSEFSGVKMPLPDELEMVKMFKAFLFSVRSNIYNYAPTNWSIIEEPEASWLGELVAEPSSIFDGL